MPSDAVQLTLSLGFSAPPWLVMTLLGACAATGATMIRGFMQRQKGHLSGQSMPEATNRPARVEQGLDWLAISHRASAPKKPKEIKPTGLVRNS